MVVCGGQKYGPIATLSEGQTVLPPSKLLATSVAIHPDLGCGYLVLLPLRWLRQVDPLHPDQWSECLGILLLLF